MSVLPLWLMLMIICPIRNGIIKSFFSCFSSNFIFFSISCTDTKQTKQNTLSIKVMVLHQFYT